MPAPRATILPPVENIEELEQQVHGLGLSPMLEEGMVAALGLLKIAVQQEVAMQTTIATQERRIAELEESVHNLIELLSLRSERTAQLEAEIVKARAEARTGTGLSRQH